MREAQYGVFLVVNRQLDSDRKTWQLARRRVGFGNLVDWLVREAKGVNPNVEVIGIDLVRRDQSRETKDFRSKKSGKRYKLPHPAKASGRSKRSEKRNQSER
jgi:hypothetical protein